MSKNELITRTLSAAALLVFTTLIVGCAPMHKEGYISRDFPMPGSAASETAWRECARNLREFSTCTGGICTCDAECFRRFNDARVSCMHHKGWYVVKYTNPKDAVLLMAAYKGDLVQVQALIAAGVGMNAKTLNDETPLYIASQKGHVEVVKLLLAAKADVNAAGKDDGATPLIIASHQGHTEVVKLLLAAKADVNARANANGRNDTPLSLAVRKGHNEVIRLLKKHGATE